MTKPIWPSEIKLPVLGVTGEYGSGKSLFIASIDPANTLLYDWEQSLGSYESLGFSRVNVPEKLQELFPDGYTQAESFEWWKDEIAQITPGTFSVIGVDPISDIEEGLVEYVKSRYKSYGFKSEEAFVSTGGIFWSKVKSTWKQILVDLSIRCQSFCFTTHLKVVWKNGKPTNETTAKGKSTLRELASLFLFMERSGNQQVPSARVIKTRLAVAKTVGDEISIVPVLPPRLLRATPAAIRAYILNPPDYAHLSEGEQQTEKKLTKAEELELQREIAADQRAGEEARLQSEQLRQKQETSRTSARAAAEAAAGTTSAAGVTEATTKCGSGSAEDPLLDAKTLLVEMTEFGVELKGFARQVYSALKARGVDVSGFKSADDLETYFLQLNEEELYEIKTKFEDTKLAC